MTKKDNIKSIPVIGPIIRWFSTIGRLPKIIDSLVKSINDCEQKLEDQKTGGYDYFIGDVERLEKLRFELSCQKLVWGDPAKLHISPKASVSVCMFNTNSGEIYVGDHTFAGSNVSLLAGAHDPSLTGEKRRTEELKSGCDIHVGNGVWLCSGATLLGPCEIGDNAVIAAGSVVVPGTIVPPNTVYGGVPAKLIKNL